ncbi:MAG TPA: adenylate/guanylate cyclase domain-containing protein [Candidatus Limnocylindrales bacterium]|nr:adenylate/guanylate cyclase domain-containing protein [Candidatus Limnocylindrales bacterium]
MAVCLACGTDNVEDESLCVDCGTPLGLDHQNEIRRFATVVNSDLKGSTALGEKLDPESLRELLTRYFDEMRFVYESHGGTIEKIIGDAVVAVFGLPQPRADDAIRAVEAAAESLSVLADLNEEFERTWGVRLVVRTGVATGDVVVGEALAGQHVLTGDTMRISSAMEQNAPPLELLIADSTYALVQEHIEVEQLAPVTPKGMDVAIPSYRVVAVHPREAEQGAGPGAETSAKHLSARESRKTVTLVFADPKPTSLTSDPPSAEALRDVMTRYFDAMRIALERHGGTVEKFIGDAVMAVYGLPVRHEDDAVRAIRAAADMQAALPELNRAFREEWQLELHNHIGVNTGEVIAGDASTGQRLVTGDAVNTAARLEQAAGQSEIILGDLTYRLARDEIEVEEIAPLTLKGKAEPVPAYRLVSVREVAAPRTTDSAPFVGREEEMGRMTSTLERLVEHAGAASLTVVGDAGVGKSRLVREFAVSVSRDAHVVRGRCLPYGDGITFWPIAEIVRGVAEIAADDTVEAAIAKISLLVGELGIDEKDRAAVVDRVAAAMGLARGQFPVAELFWGARKLLEALAREQPLVMIVDDIHAAETTLLDLLDHLVETVTAVPILILCSARHELLDRHPEWSEGHREALIMLQPLSAGDTGKMIDELLGRVGLDEEIVARIVGAAEGNPLFVEQMVSMLIDNGTLHRDRDTWVLADPTAELVVPPGIHALLAARLDALETDERDVVEPASVVGLVFAEDAVQHLVDEAQRPMVPIHLVTLAHKQFVRPDRQDDDDAYRFGHQLIRDTAYGSLLKRERVSLHQRFVEWADEVNRRRGRETEFEEILGYHLEQAYRYRSELGPLDDEAVDLGVRASTRLSSAGRRAMARGDFPAAATLLERAARVLDERDAQRPGLLLSAGEARMEIGEFPTAEELLAAASSTAAEVGAASIATTADLVRLQLHLRSEASTSIDDVTQQTLAAVDRLSAMNDPNALARAWRLLELANGVSGRYQAAGDANEKAVEYARQAGDRTLEMRLHASSAMVAFYGPMPVPVAIERCEELLVIAEGDRRSQATTLAALAHLRAMAGDFERGRDDYRRGRAILEELGLRFDASLISIDSGPVELLAGDPVAAEAELRKDYDALDAMGERNYISTIAGLLAEALYRQERFDVAAGFAKFCEEVAAPSDVYSQYLWRGIRGKLLARDGAHDEGIELAGTGVVETRASDDLEGQGNALLFLAEANAAAGRTEDAMRSAREACELFEAKGNVVSARRARAFAATGIAAAGQGVPA